MRSLSVYLICCLLLGTLACGPVTALLRPTATPPPTEVVPVETTVTAPTPTLLALPTSTPVPTVTAVPPTPTVPSATTPATAPPASAACPAPGSPRPVQPARFSDYPDAIEQYLSAGGDLGTLRGALGTWGVLPDAEDQVTVADLTGDGAEEVILALARFDAETIIRPGLLLVYGCSKGRYVTLTREGSADVEMFDPALEVVGVGDMNLDGLPDVAYVLRNCGAHTCFEQLEILGWDGTQLVSLMGGALDLPYPTYTIGPGQIEAISGGIGSVGAEPQRGYTEMWTWNGAVFTVTETIYDQPVYRYHALLDGDRALRAGDTLAASEMYRRVINDDRLESFLGIISQSDGADERAFLTAFASWRLLLTALQMGDVASAQAEFNRLQTDYSAGAVGHEIAEMADVFWTATLEGQSIAEGCAAIVAAGERFAPVLDFFNNNYGYANPWWEPEDLCLVAEG